MKCDIGHIADNLKLHERTTHCNTEEFITIFLIFIPRWITERKREIVWINTGVNTRSREGCFMDINQRLQLLPLNLNRCTCKMARNLSLSCVGKTEKQFVVDV